MEKYPKIQSLYFRDENNIIIPGMYTLPEFSYLENNKWECTEKLDGTNMQVALSADTEGNITISYHGRTEKANIPTHLEARMHELFDNVPWAEIFPNLTDTTVRLFGEGYGYKIQACGSKYLKDTVNFALFDIKIGDWWLKREDCEEIAEKIGINIVPLVGHYTIPEAVEIVKKGFLSSMSESTLQAEGLVLKTPIGLLQRNGNRIITKLKTCDFDKYKAKYGDKVVEQKINPMYK